MRTTFRRQSHSSNVQHFINASIYSHVRILDVNDLGPWSPSADVDLFSDSIHFQQVTNTKLIHVSRFSAPFFQIKKMQDRVQKTKDEVQKCREKYEQALQEINKYNPIYMEDMTSVFIKCQELEETRLRFFKNVLFSIHKTLNVTQDPK